MKLYVYVPGLIPLEQRLKDNRMLTLVYITGKYCHISEDGLSFSSDNSISMSDNFYIKTFFYIPGRSEYSSSNIYQRGELRARILADKEIMKKNAELRARSNCD